MNKVNPNEAPEGYVAVEQSINLCTGCYFDMKDKGCIIPRSSISCVDRHREDKKTVVFIKNTKSSVTFRPEAGLVSSLNKVFDN